MKNILLIILISLLLGSCLTDRKIARNCDRFARVCGQTDRKTTFKDTTITINQDIVVPIPPDTINFSGPVKVINGKAELPKVELKGNLIAADLEIHDGKINFKAYIYKSELPVKLYATITLPGAIRETKETTTVPEPYIPKPYKIAFWIVIAQLVFLAGWMIRKFNLLSIIKNLLKRI